jgi:TonB family protein
MNAMAPETTGNQKIRPAAVAPWAGRLGARFGVTQAERVLRASVATPRARLRFAAILAVSTLINALVVVGLVRLAFDGGPEPENATEISVEVIQEPPKPPPAEPPPEEQKQQAEKQPEPPPPQFMEEPATDAPREATKDQKEREAPDEMRKAPKVAPPADQTAAQPTPTPPKTSAPDSKPTSSSEEKPQEEREAEPIRNTIAPDQSNADEQAHAETKAEPKKGVTSAQELAAAFAPLPEYEFDSSAMKAPVAGGKARNTYLTQLFGMIMPHMRVPPGVAGTQRQGIVTFLVDEWGGVARIAVTKSSGSVQLDAAALSAVRRAAPFPQPPQHRPLGLNFSYGAKRN